MIFLPIPCPRWLFLAIHKLLQYAYKILILQKTMWLLHTNLLNEIWCNKERFISIWCTSQPKLAVRERTIQIEFIMATRVNILVYSIPSCREKPFATNIALCLTTSPYEVNLVLYIHFHFTTFFPCGQETDSPVLFSSANCIL
jgi:hypothetical protein